MVPGGHFKIKIWDERMKVSCIQLEIADRSKDDNVKHTLDTLEKVPDSDLILLPEIWPSGYFSFDRYQAESEPVDGQTVKAFSQKAAERGCYILMGSLVENDEGRIYNTAVLLDPEGNRVACYRKIHLFGYQSDERKILTPGREVLVVDAPWGPSGFSTCYDLRFPELFRLMLDKGATFFLIPSAWPMARLDAWRLFNRARAHENLAYLISCNCAGWNAGIQYAGHSMIVDPLGKVIAEGGENEEVVTAEIDPALVDSVRAEFSFLENRVFR
jgi:predicted amidohydrolase